MSVPHPINRNPLNPSILWNYGLDRKILYLLRTGSRPNQDLLTCKSTEIPAWHYPHTINNNNLECVIELCNEYNIY